MQTLRHLLAAAGLPAALALSHCTPYQQQGAAIGGLAGGALGAIAGDDHRDVLRGAALGAAAGTGIAAATESSGRNAPPPYGAAPQPAKTFAGNGCAAGWGRNPASRSRDKGAFTATRPDCNPAFGPPRASGACRPAAGQLPQPHAA